MAHRLVVPDASVILKWVLPSGEEPDLGQALALRDSIANGHVRAVVPSLWVYEVGNTLARRQPERAERSLDVLGAIPAQNPFGTLARKFARNATTRLSV